MITITPPAIRMHDGDGNPIGSLKGAIDIHEADVHNELVNKILHTHTGTATTLTVATTGDGTEYQITVASVAGFAVNDFLHIENGEQEPTHPKILAIVGLVFTLDRRIDEIHPIGTDVEKSILDLKTTIGTLAAPIEYWVQPPAGEVWHLTRMLFAIAHASAGDLGKFGDLAALTNGVVVRVKTNGVFRTLTNWKNTGDMKTDQYDVSFDVRSGGGGSYGTSGRWTFAKAGVVIRLDGDTNDRLQVFIQDDLTTLGFYNLKVQGHLEE